MINYSIAILSSKPGTKKADIKETKAYGMAQSSGNVDINDFARHSCSRANASSSATSATSRLDSSLREPRLPMTSTPTTSRPSTSAGSLANPSRTSAARQASSSFPVEWHRPTPSK